MVVGRLLSFWKDNFSGALLVSGRVIGTFTAQSSVFSLILRKALGPGAVVFARGAAQKVRTILKDLDVDVLDASELQSAETESSPLAERFVSGPKARFWSLKTELLKMWGRTKEEQNNNNNNNNNKPQKRRILGDGAFPTLKYFVEYLRIAYLKMWMSWKIATM